MRSILPASLSGSADDDSVRLLERLAAQMAEFSFDRKVPAVGAIGHVGNYWRNWLLVITRVGPVRPSTIRRLLCAMDPTHPLSQKMLTHNLRLLERDGLLKRAEIDGARSHVEYSLTPLGRELSDLIVHLTEWSYAHSSEMEHARRRYDARTHDASEIDTDPAPR